MKIYTDDFLAGIEEMVAMHKHGNNIFDMQDGNLFPHNTSQKTWDFAKHDDTINLHDGTHMYSFKGELKDYDTELTMLPDAPLPDLFTGKAAKKHRAQVHRSDPGSIYFTLQEGSNNPTYTLKHMADNKWKAVPKPRKVKDVLKLPVTPHNVNLPSVKEGMVKELEEMVKRGEFDLGELGHKLNMGTGKLMQGAANAPADIGMWPARHIGNSLISGAVGAGVGGAYHLAKRNLLNTQEENQQEDAEGGHALRRMLVPGLAMGGADFLSSHIFDQAAADSNRSPFPR